MTETHSAGGAMKETPHNSDGTEKTKWDHWPADHIKAHAFGGKTTVENGHAVYRACNLAKSNK